MRPHPLLASVAIAAASCTAGSDRADLDDNATIAAAIDGDTWGPNVELRDKTSPSSFEDVVRPEGGWYVAPIHANLLADGRVLITGWGRRDAKSCKKPSGTRKNATTFLLDPASLGAAPVLEVSPIGEVPQPGTRDALYCAGHAPLPDGRILFTGGARYERLGQPNELEVGLDYARLYSPSSGTFRRVAPKMLGPTAWYPTNTRLANGKVLVIGGFAACCEGVANRTIQTFDPSAFDAGGTPWTMLSPHADTPADLAPGLRDYVHSYLLPRAIESGGRRRDVAMVGWNGRLFFLDSDPATPNAVRFTSPKDAVRPGSAPAWNASAALVSTGEIMIAAGSDKPEVAQRIDFYDPSKNTWRSVSTGIGRRNPATVLLPDGTVLVINGGNEDGAFAGDPRKPQIVDPKTGSVSTFGPWTDDDDARGYHSFAVLLKDGRVLIGGGIAKDAGIGCERPNLRIYNPPYFKNGPRPVVASPPKTLNLTIGGSKATLGVSGPALRAQGGAVLMALGAATHSFDQNQRYVPLEVSSEAGKVTLSPPKDAQAAPPGDYILYLVSSAGVPSLGVHVRLAAPKTPLRRTVIFMRGTTVPGQDMFIRGGLDHDAMKARGRACTNADGTPSFACAIPIVHRNLRNATTAPWKKGDLFLDWYGRESGQNGVSNGILAEGTPADWTTNDASNRFRVAIDGFGFEPLNDVGDHLWMVDVDMDCSRAFASGGDAWFEVKSYIAGPSAPGWEPDVAQSGTPYPSRNHMAKCGMINVFARGSSEARFVALP